MLERFICFIHIEKCAGTTVQHMLHRNYPGYVTLSPTIEKGKYLTSEQLRRLTKFIPGLSGVGSHRVRCYLNYEHVLTNRQLFYLTFLRDPIDRYLSHLNYQNRVMGMGWTVDSFLGLDRYRDLQTIRIAGERNLQKAKTLLRSKIAFVGLTEDYDRSLLILRDLLDEDLDIRYQKENVSRKDKSYVRFSDLTAAQQRRVQDCNRLDSELYAFVKNDLFPQYLEHYRGRLKDDLVSFRECLKAFRYSPVSVFTRRAKYLFVRSLKVLLTR